MGCGVEKYKQKKGQWGENLAADYLTRLGYRIVDRNYRCKFGEIDIIAIKGDVLHFIEVKTRSNNNFGVPLSAITPKKLKHITKSAQYFIYQNRLYNLYISIDGIGICGDDIQFVEGILY